MSGELKILTEALKNDMPLYERNNDIVSMFVHGTYPSKSGFGTANRFMIKYKNGWGLVNYQTPMAYKGQDGIFYVNSRNYSRTTSKLQSEIMREIRMANAEYEEVDEDLLIKLLGPKE